VFSAGMSEMLGTGVEMSAGSFIQVAMAWFYIELLGT
tara:strand:+ start:215 stop:325 length:111 start_codon:yes stop_codon:yes gene_type:complete